MTLYVDSEHRLVDEYYLPCDHCSCPKFKHDPKFGCDSCGTCEEYIFSVGLYKEARSR